MARFITGDNLGNLKAVTYDKNTPTSIQELNGGNSFKDAEGQANKVTQLTAAQVNGSTMVAAGYADSSMSLFSLNDDTLDKKHGWKETRAKKNPYVGISIAPQGVFTCTSNGALRRTSLDVSDESATTSLPTRLTTWQMPKDSQTFAYGGDEVDVSVWNTERAFQSNASSESKKRKHNELFSAEVWRAKNVQHDTLNLRQPVRITALSHITPTNILAATQLGNLKRYDIRAARKPVSDWSNIFNNTGKHAITALEAGFAEHEVFISDHSNKMAAVDLRTGRILYRYDAISGCVVSIAASPTFVASTSLDRYFRVHSTTPPPPQAGQNLDESKRGKVVDKIYSMTHQTVVVWDQDTSVSASTPAVVEEDDELWDGMENVGEDDDQGRRRKNLKVA